MNDQDAEIVRKNLFSLDDAQEGMRSRPLRTSTWMMMAVAALGWALVSLTAPYEARVIKDQPEPISIGSEKQLFIDDYLIDTQERITRTFHPFKRRSETPLIIAEKPWERADMDYGTVIRDPQSGLFRMWYINFGTRFHVEDDQGLREQVCYATSKDGLHWERPNLGLVEIDGSSANNVVAQNYKNGYARALTVIYNPNAKDPTRQYIHLNQGPNGTSPSFSADGLHWSEGAPPIFMASDAATLAYDPLQDRFFAFSVSMPRARGFLRRSIAMTDTDLKTWREFATVLVADDVDDAGAPARIERLRSILDYDNPEDYHAQLHHMVAFRYESLVLGFVTVWDNVWYSEREPLYAGGRDRGLLHVQLVATRDPNWKDWQRPSQRIPIIELSEPGSWDCAVQLPYHSPVRVGDELWLYYAGFSRVFNSPRPYGGGLSDRAAVPAAGIGVAAMRLDGFASLDAGPRGGVITTKPLVFSGNKLTLNARIQGHITIEILDADGKPVKSFGRASVTGDSVKHVLTSGWDLTYGPRNIEWSRLGQLAGKPIRLRFRMWNADLYAFQFEQ